MKVKARMAKKKTKKSKRDKQIQKASEPNQALTRASLSELEAEVKRRRRVATSLERKRMRLLTAIEDIDRDLAAIGHHTSQGAAPPTVSGTSSAVVKRRGPRGSNTKTLLTHLEDALSGQVLSVSEAAQAVLSDGYQTSSKTFRTIVNQTLLANDVFEKVERGRYTARRK